MGNLFTKSTEVNEARNNSNVKSILDAARSGQVKDLLEALPEKDGEKLSIESKNLFSRLFNEDNYEFVELKPDETFSGNKTTSDKNKWTSVLLTAVNSKNTKICKFLITEWTYLIQQLPFDHKVIVSTAAYKTGQFNVLYDLLKIADYPFPVDFGTESIKNSKINKIIKYRTEFDVAIKDGNIANIEKFINENLNLKVVYNINNISALKQAVDALKINIYFDLKFRGFYSENPNENFTEAETEAKKYKIEQRKQNINEGLLDDQRSVNSLCNRSIIHNKEISKEQEKEYRKKIRNWYEDINKIKNGQELLDVAASCQRLQIIFDFENNTVEKASLADPTSAGIVYLNTKWIFIGAKLSEKVGKVTKQRYQKIKGVLAHELCHYVMLLVFENQAFPYYNNRADLKTLFEEIVQIINIWKVKDSKGPDDECNEIISKVFKLYVPSLFHKELIVRVVQILAEFDDSKEKTNYLEEKYKTLFDFWINHVIPELQMNIDKDKDVIELNKLTRLLQTILELKVEVNPAKEINDLLDSKIVIVSTNHPTLLFSDICKNLKEQHGILIDSKSVFLKLKQNDPLILSRLELIYANKLELNVFINCSEGDLQSLMDYVTNEELKYIFVVASEPYRNELDQLFKNDNPKNFKIDYNWSDLTEESQNLMLQAKINFQGNLNISLIDLLQNGKETSRDKFLHQIIDDQLLNFLVENHEISINRKVEDKEIDFDFIYQSRKFVKTDKDQAGAGIYRVFNIRNEHEARTVSQKELLSEIKEKQYVLISDMAGNGKSWAMKNFTQIIRKQNPTNWVTYVDLKQFVEVFKAQTDEPEFSTFMVEHILKPQQQFEAKIFQKMYRDGKVFILFDGFDEIAPNYAEFVSILAQNFQQNGGNQLWIATRDFFEVDLKKKLKLDIAYSLDKMTEEEGVDLIARSWMLEDLRKEKQEPTSKQEFDDCIKKSTKYENYEQKARKIIRKALIRRWGSIGLPILFKMIADTFKDEENIDDLQGIKIYDKFIDILYKRWSQQKGEIRNQANTEVQKNGQNFFIFLRYHAILSLYPELAKILFPNYDGSEWPREEIIACGILTIIDGKVYFIHETFREYFAADAIAKSLKKPKVDEKIVEVFVEILTVAKFRVIRVFLNDMITDSSVVIKIQPQVKNNIEKFNEMTSFYDFFTNNLQNFVDLVLNVLKTGSYEKVKKILKNSAKKIAKDTEDSKIFLKFQEFIFDYLKVDDLKNLIIKGKVFLGMIKFEIKIFEDFVAKTKAKTGREFVKQGLMLVSDDGYITKKRNIFYFLAESSNLNAQKVQIFLKIMEKYFTVNEIFGLMTKCNKDEQNILRACVKEKNKVNLQILWTEIEKYFTEQNLPQSFKEFVKQQDIDQKNILHYVARCEKIEVHETLWELLLKSIKDREELKEFILQKDNSGDNCVHDLVRWNKNPAIIEWTFKILKENFSDAQYQEILTSKGFRKMNLLQYAACDSTVEVHQFLWKLFQDFCGTDEKFLEMLKEVDYWGQNILHIAAKFNSSSEVFEFIIQELEKIASRDDIREMLRKLDNDNRNFMQSAADWNGSFELNKTLWKTLRKYFEKSEILQFINNVDKNGNNLLFNGVSGYISSEKIVELTWNEIKSFLSHDEQVEHLKMKGKDGKNLLECALGNDGKNRKEIYDWVKNLMQEYEIEL